MPQSIFDSMPDTQKGSIFDSIPAGDSLFDSMQGKSYDPTTGTNYVAGMTRANRNNNPLNIKASATTRAYSGVVGVEGKPAADGGNFLQFDSPESGFAAAGKLLSSKGYANLPVGAALLRWSGNGYGSDVAKQAGIDPNRKMSTLTPAEKQSLVQTMAKREGYKPGALPRMSDPGYRSPGKPKPLFDTTGLEPEATEKQVAQAQSGLPLEKGVGSALEFGAQNLEPVVQAGRNVIAKAVDFPSQLGLPSAMGESQANYMAGHISALVSPADWAQNALRDPVGAAAMIGLGELGGMALRPLISKVASLIKAGKIGQAIQRITEAGGDPSALQIAQSNRQVRGVSEAGQTQPGEVRSVDGGNTQSVQPPGSGQAQSIFDQIPEGQANAVPKANAEAQQVAPTGPEGVVYRTEEPGVASQSPSNKPQGLYVEGKGGELSSHLGGARTAYNWHPSKPLDVSAPQEGVFFGRHGVTRNSPVPLSAGIKAARHLLGDAEFQRLADLPSADLLGELKAKYPNVDWSRYADNYERIEAVGGIQARKAGYDALVDSDEKVALTDSAISPRPTGPEGVGNGASPPRTAADVQAEIEAIKARRAARAAEQAKGASPTSVRGSRATVGPEDLADAARLAKNYVELGFRSFGEWSAKMVSDFGNAIKPHLTNLYRQAHATAEDAVSRFARAIEASQPIKAEDQALKSQELAARSGKLAGIQAGQSGRAGLYSQLGALKGQLPKAAYTAPEDVLHPGDVDALINMAAAHPELRPFERLNAQQAIDKALTGQLLTDNERELVGKVLGPDIEGLLKKKAGGTSIWDLIGSAGQAHVLVNPAILGHIYLSGPLTSGMMELGKLGVTGVNLGLKALGKEPLPGQGFSLKSFASAWGNGIPRGIKEMGQVIGHGQNTIQQHFAQNATDGFYQRGGVIERFNTLRDAAKGGTMDWEQAKAAINDALHTPGMAHGMAQQPAYWAGFFRSIEEQASVLAKGDASVAKQLKSHPSEEMLLKAANDGLDLTMMKDNKLSDWMTGVMRQAKKLGTPGEAAAAVWKWFQPVFKPGTNVAFKTLEFSPVGITRGVAKLKPGISPQDLTDAITLMSNGAVGTGAIYLGYKLAEGRVIEPSWHGTAKDKQETARQANVDKNQKGLGQAIMRQLGVKVAPQPGNTTIGEHSFPTRYGGLFGSMLQVGADLWFYRTQNRASWPASAAAATLENANPLKPTLTAAEKMKQFVESLGAKPKQVKIPGTNLSNPALPAIKQ